MWLRRLGPGLVALAAFGLLTSAAGAEPGTPKKESTQNTPAPPKLTLSVRERGPRMPWEMAIENTGDSSAVVVADPRLLSFEVKVPGKRKPVRCELPKDMFPRKVDRRLRVRLGPGEGIQQSFDPRLYCFAAGGQWRLVPGALITPRYGWKPGKTHTWKRGKRVPVKPSEPFMARAADGDKDDEEAPDGVKMIDGTPFALKSTYAKWAKTRLEEDRKNKHDTPIEMRMAQGSDAHAERTATVAITLKNRSKHRQRLYFRRELVSFEVMGPDGLTNCDAQPDLRAPDPQEFLNLAAGRSMHITSRLVELCPTGTFGRPGLYLVHARLDATEDGSEFGLDAFTGRLVSEQPATIRIRSGDLPFLKRRVMRRTPGPSAKKEP